MIGAQDPDTRAHRIDESPDINGLPPGRPAGILLLTRPTARPWTGQPVDARLQPQGGPGPERRGRGGGVQTRTTRMAFKDGSAGSGRTIPASTPLRRYSTTLAMIRSPGRIAGIPGG